MMVLPAPCNREGDLYLQPPALHQRRPLLLLSREVCFFQRKHRKKLSLLIGMRFTVIIDSEMPHFGPLEQKYELKPK